MPSRLLLRAPKDSMLMKLTDIMRRTLRSGNSFGVWDGEAIEVVDKDFDLAQCMKRAVEEERDESDSENEYEYDEPGARNTQPSSAAPAEANSPPMWCISAPEAAPSAFDAYPRAKRRTRAHRKRKRQGEKPAAEDEVDVETRPSTRRKYIDPAIPIETELRLSGLRITRTGYTALRDPKVQHHEYRLDELVGPKSKFQFNLYQWDGRKPVPFLSEGKVFAVLPGRPDQAPDWDPLMTDLANTIHSALPQLSLRANQKQHRRGPFPATAHGHSYGGGQTQPMSISENPANAEHFRRILEHPGMQRVSGFDNGATKAWAPDYHRFLRQNRRTLRSRLPGLRYNFRNSVWSALTVNYGPRTATRPHKDYANLPWGWCPITALGNYDPKRGGHLVLWELRLVIEFPPGSTILIPSGLITHSNVAVGSHETRFSITQYTAGAIIRWIDQEFQSKDAFLASLTPERRAGENEKAKSRYLRGLSMYSTLDELRTHHGQDECDSDLTDLEESDEESS